MKIHVLPDEVINQIAAGEVVERPLNIVKELVENSLDAGATDIDVAIWQGGKSRIRVIDNGCGMAKHDLLLSVERHATSKISVFDDLSRLGTMGFRGEALPSIASVSRSTLTSREPHSDSGYTLHIHGGKIIQLAEVAANPGTTVEIAALFFNIPARKKFLRTTSTEQQLIAYALEAFALAHPTVAFRFEVDDAPSLLFPIASETQRIQQVLGRENARNLAFGEAHSEHGSARGYFSRPDSTRSRRDLLYCFVNRRIVKDKLLSTLLMRCYEPYIPKGRFPFGALYIDIDPALVDVNVHPTKTEVRFFNISAIEALLQEAFRTALAGSEQQPLHPALPSTSVSTPAPHSMEPTPTRTVPTRTAHQPLHREHTVPVATTPDRVAHREHLYQTAPVIDTPSPIQETIGDAEQLTIYGQFADSFVIAEYCDELILVDQHAAMERINVEELENRYAEETIPAQPLLFPHRLPLSAAQQRSLAGHQTLLGQLGFTVEVIEDTACLIAAPVGIPSEQAIDTVVELCDLLGKSKGHSETSLAEFRAHALRTMACHRSIKAGKTLSHQQMHELLQRLFQCRFPYTCPHGRPIILRYSRERLCHEFLRS
ncbi:DNA mismatch repair endonuclease MutL [Chrysiogenes arsenatis]|uniref:DNA mismatch repair endonuclease MutL n=1 Tax=Chrysiogenes arsenatis TaxID=309797 RepID=UPI0004151591|nr:DNA mismatch repair endonuclease MutL [Chrysiogenes arsenatis]